MKIQIKEEELIGLIETIIMVFIGGFVIQGMYWLGHIEIGYWQAEGIYILLRFIFDI